MNHLLWRGKPIDWKFMKKVFIMLVSMFAVGWLLLRSESPESPVHVKSPQARAADEAAAAIERIDAAHDEATAKALKPDDLNIRGIAWVAAKEYIKDQLKAPGTADFPWSFRDSVHEISADTYHVSSYVDAQNSFGGKLRNWFECDVWTDGDRARVLGCKFRNSK
jgi:hypothetical protein